MTLLPLSWLWVAAVAGAQLPQEGYLGVLVAPAYAIVSSRAEGRLATLEVRVGDEVTAGQLLARVEPDLAMTDVQTAAAAVAMAKADLARANIEARQAAEQADRLVHLGEYVPAEERRRAIHERQARRQMVAAAKAAVEEKRSRLQRVGSVARDITLQAPFAGVVARRYLEAGASCSVATPVLLLFAKGTPRLRFAVPPEVAARISPGQKVRATIEGVAGSVAATITRVAPDLDAAALMVFVEASLGDSTPQLALARPGLVARVTVEEAR
jgi:RND family efflux transporter MFP subunit